MVHTDDDPMEHSQSGAPMGSESRRHDLDPAIGAMLARRRRALGWSLRIAVRRTGISFWMIGLMERGQRAPSIVLAVQLARAYRLTESDVALLLSGAVSDVGRDYPYRW
jgi:transcriptional regulator with XRE-family HTH domain